MKRVNLLIEAIVDVRQNEATDPCSFFDPMAGPSIATQFLLIVVLRTAQ